MLGWIPILGPIIDGIVSIWKGYQNVDIIKYTTDGKVDIAAMQASQNIIASTKDDIGIRLARDILIYPTIIWLDFFTWDQIVSPNWPHLYFPVGDYPANLAYLPYSVVAFLLGNIGLNIWGRR